MSPQRKKIKQKTFVLCAIGILAFVLLITNYLIMYPIAQQQYVEFKSALWSYGMYGDYEYYGSIEEAMKSGGLVFSNDWKNLYDAYNLTMTEIYAFSIICLLAAALSFSYAVYTSRKPTQSTVSDN